MSDEETSQDDSDSSGQEYNAADPKKVKRKKLDAAREEVQRLEGLKELMNSPNGRKWMWGLMGICKMYHSSFSGDVNTTLFNEGTRNVGLQIQADIHRVAAKEYFIMMQENGDTNA